MNYSYVSRSGTADDWMIEVAYVGNQPHLGSLVVFIDFLSIPQPHKISSVMSQQSSITYSPLSSETKQIRTLTLRAGEANDPLRCSLHLVSLEKQPLYEALSYTWGDTTYTIPIEVDGVQFNATENLAQALRHIREADRELTLWVDSGEQRLT